MFCYWSSSKDIALLEKDNINKKNGLFFLPLSNL